MNFKTILSLFAGIALIVSSASGQEVKINFENQILPIFKARCFKCHQKEYVVGQRAPDDAFGFLSGKQIPIMKKPQGEFRMDNPQLMLKGGSTGGDITPGKPMQSTVYTFTLLTEDDDMAMPPTGNRITDKQKDLIKDWIAQGAEFGTWRGSEQ